MGLEYGNDPPATTPEDRKEAKYGVRVNTAFHQDAGKTPFEQLPVESLEQVARVFGYGASKYGPYNWLEHADKWDWTQLIGSLFRHSFAWLRRENDDPESGLPHLAHAAANALMLLQLCIRRQGKDDRPPVPGGAPKLVFRDYGCGFLDMGLGTDKVAIPDEALQTTADMDFSDLLR